MPYPVENLSAPLPESGEMPQNFGIYRILGHLGRGGMGDVYKAVHTGLDRVVALKVLRVPLATPEFLERFNAEAFSISRLQHHNIVTIYDYGELDSRRYIAMQFVEGLTLTELIRAYRPLPYARVTSLGKQICRALKYAHENGVIHRDVKPGNVMVDKDDRAFLSDFGIAKSAASTRLTTTGMAMGTPEYMSPEQCEGKPLDAKCDIYGLGIALYEMVAGRPPFTADNPLAVAYKQVHETPALLSKIRPDIPRSLEMVVAKCLKKSVDDRFESAGELLDTMDAVAVGGQAKSRPSKPTPVPSENRITERREKDRRFGLGPLEMQPLLPLLPLVASVVVLLYALVVLHRAGRGGAGAGWIPAENIELATAGKSGTSPAGLRALVDGDSRTAVASPDLDAGFLARLERPYLVQGVWLSWKQPAPSMHFAVAVDGRREGEWVLPPGRTAGFFAVSPVVGRELGFYFGPLARAGSGDGVREFILTDIAIAGLPAPEGTLASTGAGDAGP